MKTLSQLTFQYYRILLLYNLAFSVLWLFLALFGFDTLNLVVCFWAAVAGFWSAVAVHYYSAAYTYFYFRNVGVRMRRVISFTFLFDIIIFLVIAAAYYAVKSIKG